MTGQGFDLPPVGMAVAVVIPVLDLSGGSSQLEEDGRLLEQPAGRRIQARGLKERQGGQGAEQQRIVQALALPGDGKLVEGLEGSQFEVQGHQVIQRPRGHGSGHQGTFPPAQGIEGGGLVLTEPCERHGAPP